MPALLNSLELRAFYGHDLIGKTILPNNKFYVTFLENEITKALTAPGRALLKRCGSMPIIKHYHILSCNVPSYDFKKETQQYGPLPRSFPYMDFDGFELKMEFEEDRFGTIGYFINWCQRRIVDTRGVYTPPQQHKIDRIIIEVEDQMGIPVAIYFFNDCYFLNSSPLNLDYAGNDSIKYSVVFNSDYMGITFPKKAPVQAAMTMVKMSTPGY